MGKRIVVAAMLLGSWGGIQGLPPQTPVHVKRVPEGGIQPQAVVDPSGTLHLIFFQGDPAHGDIYYVRSRDGTTFSSPLRVNSQPGSAVGAGTVRGPQLSVEPSGRPHVCWMGSRQALPRAPGGATPLLYARLNEQQTAFEEQRNLIRERTGLDGGLSIAAGPHGRVWVVWHAPPEEEGTEGDRQVWVSRSQDAGQSFETEQAVWDVPTGACGCCGMRALADSAGQVYLVYRSARDQVHRDMYLLNSPLGTLPFRGHKLDSWRVNYCVMSTASLSPAPGGVQVAWETEGQIYTASFDTATQQLSRPVPMPGSGGGRKHPSVAAGEAEVLVAWVEGSSWGKGGSLAWQLFGSGGRVREGQGGFRPGVPPWGLPAVVFRPNQGFVIFY